MVCVLGVSGDGSGPWGAVGVLDRVLGRRRGPPSADDSHSSVDACRILSFLQPAEAGRLVLLVLRATVTAPPWGSVEPTRGVSPVSRMRGGVWASRVWGRIGWSLLGDPPSVLSGNHSRRSGGGQRWRWGVAPLILNSIYHLVLLFSCTSSSTQVFGSRGLRWTLLFPA